MAGNRGALCDLFVYGTLMAPDVMQRVTGKTFHFVPATLADYARYRIKRRVYPAIIACSGGTVDGLLYTGVDDASLRRLDAFESGIYERRTVSVQRADGEQATAWVYVLAPSYTHLLRKAAWSLEEFKRVHLSAYLTRL